jgi:hypothetical protein
MMMSHSLHPSTNGCAQEGPQIKREDSTKNNGLTTVDQPHAGESSAHLCWTTMMTKVVYYCAVVASADDTLGAKAEPEDAPDALMIKCEDNVLQKEQLESLQDLEPVQRKRTQVSTSFIAS